MFYLLSLLNRLAQLHLNNSKLNQENSDVLRQDYSLKSGMGNIPPRSERTTDERALTK